MGRGAGWRPQCAPRGRPRRTQPSTYRVLAAFPNPAKCAAQGLLTTKQSRLGNGETERGPGPAVACPRSSSWETTSGDPTSGVPFIPSNLRVCRTKILRLPRWFGGVGTLTIGDRKGHSACPTGFPKGGRFSDIWRVCLSRSPFCPQDACVPRGACRPPPGSPQPVRSLPGGWGPSRPSAPCLAGFTSPES